MVSGQGEGNIKLGGIITQGQGVKNAKKKTGIVRRPKRR